MEVKEFSSCVRAEGRYHAVGSYSCLLARAASLYLCCAIQLKQFVLTPEAAGGLLLQPCFSFCVSACTVQNPDCCPAAAGGSGRVEPGERSIAWGGHGTCVSLSC